MKSMLKWTTLVLISFTHCLLWSHMSSIFTAWLGIYKRSLLSKGQKSCHYETFVTSASFFCIIYHCSVNEKAKNWRKLGHVSRQLELWSDKSLVTRRQRWPPQLEVSWSRKKWFRLLGPRLRYVDSPETPLHLDSPFDQYENDNGAFSNQSFESHFTRLKARPTVATQPERARRHRRVRYYSPDSPASPDS